MIAGASSAPEGEGWMVHELDVGSKSAVPVEAGLKNSEEIANRVIDL